MLAILYKKHWNIVKCDIIDFFREFFRGGLMDEENNKTVIILLQNKNNPTNLSHF